MVQSSSHDPQAEAEALARAYIDTLAEREGIKARAMIRSSSRDVVDELLGESAADPDAMQLRADLVVAAVLTARAIAVEPGLARRLRKEGPVVAIQAHTGELTELVGDIIDRVATPIGNRKWVVVRDGTEKSHTPEKGNSEVVQCLNKRWPVIGVASDPRRHLPSSLMRMCEYRLTIPALDEWTLRLTLEAVTGKAYDGAIDADLVRVTDLTDLSLSLRRDLSPEECLSRLETIVRDKSAFVGDGPSLEDLAGYGEAKTWGLELVADLADYRAGRISWTDVDHKGLLLSGPPGTGKTSFAKALAKSARVALVSTSVADWNAATYLSGTLQAIRTVFAEAKRSAPSILFIDELDGISSRDTLRGDYVEYWTQIVNLLLECLAGIEDRAGVVVLAATNHPTKIDPAILRAGRLDHHIALKKPDFAALQAIFRLHLGSEALVGIDLTPVALVAHGGTGADVETWVRRAKASARRRRVPLTVDDLTSQVLGSVPAMAPNARRRVAVHEAGHAVASLALKVGTLVEVSIVRDGGATAMTELIPGDATEAAIESVIAVLLAGRVAEELILGAAGIGGGAPVPESDLARATAAAISAEVQFGYGDALGLAHFPAGQLTGIAHLPGVLEAVKRRLEEGQALARKTLSENADQLAAISRELDAKGYLSADDVVALVPTLGSIASTVRVASR